MKQLIALLAGGVLAATLGVGCSKDDSKKPSAKQQKTKIAKNEKPAKTPVTTTNELKQVTLAISGMT